MIPTAPFFAITPFLPSLMPSSDRASHTSAGGEPFGNRKREETDWARRVRILPPRKRGILQE